MRGDAYIFVDNKSAQVLNPDKAYRRGAKANSKSQCPYSNKSLKEFWHKGLVADMQRQRDLGNA